MATADFTVATPSPTSGAAYDELAANNVADANNVKTDAATQQKFLTGDFQQFQLPQLRSSIAANGQFYGTAKNRDEAQLGQNFLHQSYDIQSAANRQLDDLTRQRMMASLGLVI